MKRISIVTAALAMATTAYAQTPMPSGASGRLRRGRGTHADEDADQLDGRAAAR